MYFLIKLAWEISVIATRKAGRMWGSGFIIIFVTIYRFKSLSAEWLQTWQSVSDSSELRDVSFITATFRQTLENSFIMAIKYWDYLLGVRQPERADLMYMLRKCWAEFRAEVNITASKGSGSNLELETTYPFPRDLSHSFHTDAGIVS